MSQSDLQKRLAFLETTTENKVCVDCSVPISHEWVSIFRRPPGSSDVIQPLGAFTCTKCSAIHKSLGTEVCFVKSISADSFEESQVIALERGGNKIINLIYEGGLYSQNLVSKLEPDAISLERRGYIVQKYVKRVFYDRAVHEAECKPKPVEYNFTDFAFGTNLVANLVNMDITSIASGTTLVDESNNETGMIMDAAKEEQKDPGFLKGRSPDECLALMAFATSKSEDQKSSKDAGQDDSEEKNSTSSSSLEQSARSDGELETEVKVTASPPAVRGNIRRRISGVGQIARLRSSSMAKVKGRRGGVTTVSKKTMPLQDAISNAPPVKDDFAGSCIPADSPDECLALMALATKKSEDPKSNKEASQDLSEGDGSEHNNSTSSTLKQRARSNGKLETEVNGNSSPPPVCENIRRRSSGVRQIARLRSSSNKVKVRRGSPTAGSKPVENLHGGISNMQTFIDDLDTTAQDSHLSQRGRPHSRAPKKLRSLSNDAVLEKLGDSLMQSKGQADKRKSEGRSRSKSGRTKNKLTRQNSSPLLAPSPPLSAPAPAVEANNSMAMKEKRKTVRNSISGSRNSVKMDYKRSSSVGLSSRRNRADDSLGHASDHNSCHKRRSRGHDDNLSKHQQKRESLRSRSKGKSAHLTDSTKEIRRRNDEQPAARVGQRHSISAIGISKIANSASLIELLQ